MLEHLKDARNKIVHGTERDDQSSYLVFQLKNFVDIFFYFT